MRTNLDLAPSALHDDLDNTQADFVGYNHPKEIVADPLLTIGRKRALLAHWLSDIHAVRGMPALRRSPCGVTADVDDLQAALRQLDDIVEPLAIPGFGQKPQPMVP